MLRTFAGRQRMVVKEDVEEFLPVALNKTGVEIIFRD